MALAVPSSVEALGELMPFMVHIAEQRVDFIIPPADLDFDRPFWHVTMKEVIAADKAGEQDKVSVSLDELRQAVGSHQPNTAGMIFHIGRCGSTLVSRMIGHDRSKLVLRESLPVSGLHRASSGSDRVPTFTIEQAFKDLLVAFDAFAKARSQSVVIKHSSWESFSMGRIAQLLPSTPIVFVYRNPIATVESSLDGHPMWAARLSQPRSMAQRWIPRLEHVDQPYTAAAMYAAVWASGAEAALSVLPETVLLIDHATLTSEPRSALEQVAGHLHLDLDMDLALNELNHYSKATQDDTAFDPHGRHAHPPLSARTRAQVLDIVGDLPDRLADRIAQQSTSPDCEKR